MADAFEVFIGTALKGEHGQFFTPRNIVKMMVEILDPDNEDLIIDPACGSGGFLIDVLKHIWQRISKKGKDFNWNNSEMDAKQIKQMAEHAEGLARQALSIQSEPDAKLRFVGAIQSLVKCIELIVAELEKAK